MNVMQTIRHIRKAKRREAEYLARLEESSRRIDERRRAWYEANGMTYYKDMK